MPTSEIGQPANCGRLHRLDQRRAVGDRAVGLLVAVAIGVHDAEGDRIHADEARQLVHLNLERKIGDGHAEAAHRRGRRAVGVDAVGVDPDIGDGVGAGHVGGGLGGAVRAVARIGAGIDIDADVAGDDPPVLHDAVLDVDALGGARAGDLHLLLAAVGVFDRTAGEHRGEKRRRLGDDVDLAAEAAADGAADQAQFLERRVEDEGGVVEGEEQGLGVRVAGEAAVRFRHDDAAGGLGRRMLDRRGLVALLDDVVGDGEALLDVAMADAAEGMALIGEIVVAVIFVDDRRAGLQRLLDVEDGGQDLVVDLHLGRGLAGDRVGFGDDGDDLLALEADLALGEHRLVVRLDLDQAKDRVDVRRHVLVGEDADDARHLLRRRGVDMEDAGVIVRASRHLQMEHAREGCGRRRTGSCR